VKEEDKILTYEETTYYSLKDIVEVIDIVIGDDGFRSNEAAEVLRLHFLHIHYPIMINQKCKTKHEKE